MTRAQPGHGKVTRRYPVPLSDDLWMALRAICSQRKLTLREAILEALRIWVVAQGKP
jgi:hypothetical protein